MVREVVARYLEQDGLACTSWATATRPSTWLRLHRPDLVVLDVMLPGVDGLVVLRRIRADGDMPVILLTARTEEIDRVRRPRARRRRLRRQAVLTRELAVRVRNMLRRAASGRRRQPTAALRVRRPLRIDPAAREVAVDGRAVALTPKEFDLLRSGRARRARCSPAASCSTRCGTRRPSTRTRPPSPCTSAGCARSGDRPRASALDRDGVGRRLPVRAVMRSRPRSHAALARGSIAASGQRLAALATAGASPSSCSPPRPSAPGWRCAR